ncbi:MAG TPA: Hsp70 family protein [Acidimicrobiales bacterium]|nr:Hsp70 family protein [Acidimicrobiales bacterium]
MTYAAGIDVGTTYSAAATWRDGRATTVVLGDRAATVPSVLFLREDGVVLVGEAAVRRAVAEPRRVVREFKRRVGDTVPIVLGDQRFGAADLTARVVRWLADKVAEREGGPPDYTVLTHPASWGEHRRAVLADAAATAGLPSAGLVPEPVAAGLYYAAQQRVPAGALLGVYDLGGGTFDATILRKTATGFEVLGTPRGDDRLGGLDVDQIVLDHVVRAVGPSWPQVDDDDRIGLAALAQVRQAAVEAKEALSADTQAVVPLMLPGCADEVRITRTELERQVRPLVAHTVDLMRQTCSSAGVAARELDAVLLVGGSSRMPVVAQVVTAELGVPVVVDAHPKYAVCLGASIAAAARLGAVIEPPAPAPPPLPPAPVPGPAPAIEADLEEAGLTGPSDRQLPRSRRPPPAMPMTDVDDRLVVHIGGAGADEGAERRERRRVAALAGASLAVVVALVAGLVWLPGVGGGEDPGPPPGTAPAGTGAALGAAAGKDEVRGTARVAGGPLAGDRGPGAMLGVASLGGSRLVAVGRRNDPAARPAATSEDTAGIPDGASGPDLGGRPAAWRSDDGGATWTAAWTAPAGAHGAADGVAAAPGGGLVAVGWSAAAAPAGSGGGDRVVSHATVWRSAGDAAAWTAVAATGLDGAAALHDVAADGAGGLVAVGWDTADDPRDGDAGVWRSADGVAWRRTAAAALGGAGRQELHRIVRLPDGRWLALGRQLRGASLVPTVWTSPDLSSWSEVAGRPASPDGVPSLWGVTVLADGTVVLAGSRPGLPGAEGGSEPALWWATPSTLGRWRRFDPGSAAARKGDQQIRALVPAGAPGLRAVGDDADHAATWTVDLHTG